MSVEAVNMGTSEQEGHKPTQTEVRVEDRMRQASSAETNGESGVDARNGRQESGNLSKQPAVPTALKPSGNQSNGRQGVLRGGYTKIDWNDEEDLEILRAHMRYKNKWLDIAAALQSKSNNRIKNRFYSIFRKVKSKILKNDISYASEYELLELYYIISVIEEYFSRPMPFVKTRGKRGKDFVYTLLRSLDSDILREYKASLTEAAKAEGTMEDLLQKLAAVAPTEKAAKPKDRDKDKDKSRCKNLAKRKSKAKEKCRVQKIAHDQNLPSDHNPEKVVGPLLLKATNNQRDAQKPLPCPGSFPPSPPPPLSSPSLPLSQPRLVHSSPCFVPAQLPPPSHPHPQSQFHCVPLSQPPPPPPPLPVPMPVPSSLPPLVKDPEKFAKFEGQPSMLGIPSSGLSEYSRELEFQRRSNEPWMGSTYLQSPAPVSPPLLYSPITLSAGPAAISAAAANAACFQSAPCLTDGFSEFSDEISSLYRQQLFERRPAPQMPRPCMRPSYPPGLYPPRMPSPGFQYTLYRNLPPGIWQPRSYYS